MTQLDGSMLPTLIYELSAIPVKTLKWFSFEILQHDHKVPKER